MGPGGIIGAVFGTGENAPINAAIFVIVLCAGMGLLIVFFHVEVGGLSQQAMLANIRELAMMALAYLFGRTGKP
jgi:hypothetical protein